MARMTQKAKILEYLRIHGAITAQDAIGHFQCYRLAARIADLRADGYNIITESRDLKGNPVNYAIYKLKEERNA